MHYMLCFMWKHILHSDFAVWVFSGLFLFCNLICEMAIIGKKKKKPYYFLILNEEVGKFRTTIIQVLVLSANVGTMLYL